MSLPVIDIPVQLPFDVPLLIHPIFVHFAIAIPVIVLLIELINIKANKTAVSITSLFLLTLLMVVYAGSFFTGKADGLEALSSLSLEAKEELKEHKLLGIYMVYATSILFLFKVLAMLIKQNWLRNIFLILLVLFTATAFKEGKDGGELVYKYGVNVKTVNELQSRADDMQNDIDTIKQELKKAKESSSIQNIDTTKGVVEAQVEHYENDTSAAQAIKEDETTIQGSQEAETVVNEVTPETLTIEHNTSVKHQVSSSEQNQAPSQNLQ